jgi:hypothetical protein
VSRGTLFLLLLWLAGIAKGSLYGQVLAGVAIHGFGTQGILFSSNNNYLGHATEVSGGRTVL